MYITHLHCFSCALSCTFQLSILFPLEKALFLYFSFSFIKKKKTSFPPFLLPSSSCSLSNMKRTSLFPVIHLCIIFYLYIEFLLSEKPRATWTCVPSLIHLTPWSPGAFISLQMTPFTLPQAEQGSLLGKHQVLCIWSCCIYSRFPDLAITNHAARDTGTHESRFWCLTPKQAVNS